MEYYFHSRKLLTSSTPSPETKPNKFDANLLTIMAVLLCGVACALALNAFVRVVVQCACRICGPATGTSALDEPCAENQPGHAGPRKNSVKALPAAVYTPEHGKISVECAICLSEFHLGEDIRVLPACHHIFHVACVDRWLTAKSTCPTCRKSPFAGDRGPVRQLPPDASTLMDQEGRLARLTATAAEAT